jgi:hypothetical protein
MRIPLNCFNSFLLTALSLGATAAQADPLLTVHLSPGKSVADIAIPKLDFVVTAEGGDLFTGFRVTAFKHKKAKKGEKELLEAAGRQSYALGQINHGFDFDAEGSFPNLLFIKGNNLTQEGGSAVLVAVRHVVGKGDLSQNKTQEKRIVSTSVTAGAAGEIPTQYTGISYPDGITLETTTQVLKLAKDPQGWHITDENGHEINTIDMVIDYDSQEKNEPLQKKVISDFSSPELEKFKPKSKSQKKR